MSHGSEDGYCCSGSSTPSERRPTSEPFGPFSHRRRQRPESRDRFAGRPAHADGAAGPEPRGEKTGRKSAVPRSVSENGSVEGSSSNIPETLNGAASRVTS